jgi:hypothetical protein
VLLAFFALPGCPQLLDDTFGTLPAQPSTDAGNGGREPPGSDIGPPRVLSSSPANGARGVPSNASIEINFSEPMDTAATIAAYTSTDLPAAALTFAWRNNDSVLVLTPRQPLPVASGTDPDSVTARELRFQIGSGARDAGGTPLAPAPVSIAFTTLREIAQTFDTVRDRNLTGNFRGDMVYGVFECEQQDTSVCAGDGLGATEAPYRGFLTFDLAPLPKDGIESAELSLSISAILNGPFELGALLVEQTSFPIIDYQAFQQNREAQLGVLATAAVVGQILSLDATASVIAKAGGLGQYRLRFDSDTNSDGAPDIILCDWTTPHLTVNYRLP